MKTKVLKLSAIFAIFGLALLVFVGCGVSQSYADKVNEAAKAEEYITKAEVFKKLGEPTQSAIVDLLGNGGTGAATWYVGCKTANEATEKVEAGKSVKYLTVNFINGDAISATYGVMEQKEEQK